MVLNINDVEDSRKEVTFGAGNSEIVTFTVANDVEGRYTINIDGNVGQFNAIASLSREPEPTPTEPIQPTTKWWLIGIIVGCIVATGLLVYFFVWRKRSTA
ncbi:hypothetical protein ACFLT4_04015 [Chloroflexota bacterium]